MAARRRDLPEIAVGTLTSDGTNAADVVTQWVADGVTAVCAQNDETGLVVLQGIWEANLKMS